MQFDTDCSGDVMFGFEWDLAEPCFTFYPTLGTTAGQADSVSNPILSNNDQDLQYGWVSACVRACEGSRNSAPCMHAYPQPVEILPTTRAVN